MRRHIIKTHIQFLGAAATNYSVVPWGGAAFNTTQFSREELVIHIADWGERSEPHTCGINGKLSIYMYNMYIYIYMYVWYVRIPYIYILPHLCAMQYFHIACYSDRFTVAQETRLARQKG